MDIKTIVLDYLDSKSIQDFLNRRYQDKSKVILSRDRYNLIGNEHGLFNWDNMVETIESADHDYDISNLKPDDIALDIGACIGAFAIKASHYCKHVYAVEPIYANELRKNIALNHINNITVLDYSLGTVERDFNGLITENLKDFSAKFKTLPELIDLCNGHVDFIKCDCEGGEWIIKPDELKDIRIFEAEIHINDKKYELKNFEELLTNAGFEYTKEIFGLYKSLMLIHAKRY